MEGSQGANVWRSRLVLDLGGPRRMDPRFASFIAYDDATIDREKITRWIDRSIDVEGVHRFRALNPGSQGILGKWFMKWVSPAWPPENKALFPFFLTLNE